MRLPCAQFNSGLQSPHNSIKFLEHSRMRRVKALMIARHVLAWLWLLLWLTAAPGVRACVVSSTDASPGFSSVAEQEQHSVHDLAGLHFRALRSSRRFDAQPSTTDLVPGIWSFQASNFRLHDLSGSYLNSEAPLGLTSGWQFLLRTALSPRAPSFVS